jgi:cell division protein ZapA
MNKPASKQIEVQIMGQSYLLACPVGGESALLDAVERVDTAMCRIRDAGKVKARDRIAVLASLNLAFELSQKESEHFEHSAFGQTGAAPLTESSTPVLADKDPVAQARIDELIRRLDNTLGNDGQLL